MLLPIVFVLIALLLPSQAETEVSPNGLWTDVNERGVATTGTRDIVPRRYRLLSLDRSALKRLLDTVPLEDTGTPGILFTLPLPEGGFAQFSVVESPIMAPELAAQFPELKTYLGTGIDDPTASLRFSVTPQGLHAQVLSASGALYIDPYQSGDDRHHISYARQDYKRTADTEPPACYFSDLPQPQSPLGQSLVSPQISSGTQRRTYRTVIATTGEYTAFHGGTVAGALAAVVVALNRVNGLYERDVAVRMVLVANNNLVIYTNAATDPYTNDDGFAMLDENQANLDTIIGSANYDIGHVFSTGGGGVAQLFSPCRNFSKARGVTGLPSPIGDHFYIDFVAHEMGHQFGANHTFNSEAGACGGGNRNASTAYEPGSGSTIMAYAGICGSDNLQPNSDADFHGISIEEMVKFTTGQVIGFNGDVCAVKANTSNTPPTVDAGPNGSPAFTIPINTPFQLTGTASDVNGDALTYDWEQFNLGPAGAPNSPSGTAPIFRSFLPSTSRTRTFPKLTNLLNNTQTIGELLPSYGRALTFRLTVRDNHAGGGGINQDTIELQVSGSAGPFQVTAPNIAVRWVGSSTQTVTWDVAGTTAAPVSCASVNLLLSTDGGNTFPTTILTGTPNDGNQVITVPNAVTTQARLKVACANNIFFDVSNTNFTIIDAPRTLRINDVTLTEGNVGNKNFIFTVTLSPAAASTVTVDCVTANGTATAPSDYIAGTTPLSFTPGETSKTCTVPVVGNTVMELNETFLVNLSAPIGAAIADGQGLGTILNDDGPVLSIDDVTLTEGNEGNKNFVFTVTLSPAAASTVTVDCVTANGTATAPSDYIAGTTPLSFTPGQTSKTCTVPVVGNTVVEPNETFFVNLTSPVGAATIADGQGLGTILNDDGPLLRIDNVTLTEGNVGNKNFVFTVTLSPAAAGTVTVRCVTANETATAPGDFIAGTTPLSFTPGQTSKTCTVPVVSDRVREPNETFFVNLSDPSGATLGVNFGVGTIENDD